jgi:hypothetical protein
VTGIVLVVVGVKREKKSNPSITFAAPTGAALEWTF